MSFIESTCRIVDRFFEICSQDEYLHVGQLYHENKDLELRFDLLIGNLKSAELSNVLKLDEAYRSVQIVILMTRLILYYSIAMSLTKISDLVLKKDETALETSSSSMARSFCYFVEALSFWIDETPKFILSLAVEGKWQHAKESLLTFR